MSMMYRSHYKPTETYRITDLPIPPSVWVDAVVAGASVCRCAGIDSPAPWVAVSISKHDVAANRKGRDASDGIGRILGAISVDDDGVGAIVPGDGNVPLRGNTRTGPTKDEVFAVNPADLLRMT
jgi:hypothetical protein